MSLWADPRPLENNGMVEQCQEEESEPNQMHFLTDRERPAINVPAGCYNGHE